MRIVLSLLLANGFFTQASDSRFDHIDPGLVALVEQIDAKTSALQTMRAHFIHRKELELLIEPVEMEGTLYIKRPDGMRFEYEEKEDLTLIITTEEMVTLSPKAKQASRIALKKQRVDITSGILTKYLKDIIGHFNLTRRVSDQGTHLVLEPRLRKMKKKFREIHLWINLDYNITHMKVTIANGDTYDLELSEIEEDITLSSDLFDTHIPEGYKISEGMEAIFGPDAGL
jgi:outer membrane lipoprotein-sorting protein